MISSLVEWIENMDEWELKINILRFIGTVAYLLGAWSKTWISTSDLKTQAPGNKNILRLLSWNDGACFVRCCNGLYLLYILINAIKKAYFNLKPTVITVFFWLYTVERDVFIYFAEGLGLWWGSFACLVPSPPSVEIEYKLISMYSAL